jgi:hypothetical protein
MIPEPPKEKKKIGRKLLALILVIWGVNHLITSNLFESEIPTIEMDKIEHWNLAKPINLKITDNYAIKSFKVIIDNGDGEVVNYKSGDFEKPDVQNIDINISLPRSTRFKNNYTTIHVEVTDFSNWNFFAGNQAELTDTVIVDTSRPNISIINSSYGIRRGGSATVVFKVDDLGNNSTLDEVYIETSSGRKFLPQPLVSTDSKYFVSLVAWPINDITFKGKVVAKDKAGNESSSDINLYLKEKSYKVSNMTLKDSFLNGKIRSLASNHEKSEFTDSITEYFKIVNEDIRAENEKLLFEITTQIDKSAVVNDFDIKPFSPLRGSSSVASFGDHRKYFYDNEFISEAYHMGLDLASVKMAPIVSTNKGKIVYNEDNGVYGKTPIVDHGLGLYTIYSHCSATRVQVGDMIDNGHIIANTGKTGLALGDHLHFGIYVQGIPVRPEEWMDKDWIKTNVTDIIAGAKKIVERG